MDRKKLEHFKFYVCCMLHFECGVVGLRKKNFTQIFVFAKNSPEVAQASRGCWRGGREGGVTPPPKKKVHKKIKFRQKFPRRPPGVTGGGGEERGVTPPPTPQTSFHPKKLFRQKSPEGATAVAGRQEVLKGGRKGGEVFPTFKKTGREAPHNSLVFYKNHKKIEA